MRANREAYVFLRRSNGITQSQTNYFYKATFWRWQGGRPDRKEAPFIDSSPKWPVEFLDRAKRPWFFFEISWISWSKFKSSSWSSTIETTSVVNASPSSFMSVVASRSTFSQPPIDIQSNDWGLSSLLGRTGNKYESVVVAERELKARSNSGSFCNGLKSSSWYEMTHPPLRSLHRRSCFNIFKWCHGPFFPIQIIHSKNFRCPEDGIW